MSVLTFPHIYNLYHSQKFKKFLWSSSLILMQQLNWKIILLFKAITVLISFLYV